VPFTADDFLDVFAAYNSALWPFATVLWVITFAACAALIADVAGMTSWYRALLAAHWIWVGAVYHALFFASINPAAWLFAALFVAQGFMFIFVDLADGAFVLRATTSRRMVSSLLVVYSLIYPAIAWADGFGYPRMPAFGVPCPTVLLTIGFLVAAPTASIRLSVIPVAWSLIGATAVSLFGMRADLALPAAGIVLVADLIIRRSHVMKKIPVNALSLLFAATLILLPVSSALAQADHQHDHQQQAQKGATKMDGMKMGEMKMNPRMMEEMAAKKKANTERLAALMAQMKNASGDAKVAAMAEVIGVLIEERADMQEHCAAMMAAMKK
jgi:hypothetical protein